MASKGANTVGLFVGNDTYIDVDSVDKTLTAVLGRRLKRDAGIDWWTYVQVFLYDNSHTARAVMSGRSFATIEDVRLMRNECSEKVGVKVTIENHWGLSANAMNMRIILDEVNHPYCEASPDFCNWEHKYMLYHGLEAVMPYTHTTVHAKYWDRWDNVDIGRCVQILNHAGFRGKIALEYEAGPWDGVEGAQRLMKDVLAAL